MTTIRQACRTINHLEDLIDMAKQGQTINLKVNLKKQHIAPKQPPEKPYFITANKDMYLLIAEFLFETSTDTITIPKVYALGCVAESITEEQVNKSVANERLKIDYKRLREAGIKMEEKSF